MSEYDPNNGQTPPPWNAGTPPAFPTTPPLYGAPAPGAPQSAPNYAQLAATTAGGPKRGCLKASAIGLAVVVALGLFLWTQCEYHVYSSVEHEQFEAKCVSGGGTVENQPAVAGKNYPRVQCVKDGKVTGKYPTTEKLKGF